MSCLPEIELCAIQGDTESYVMTFTTYGTTPYVLTGSTITMVVCNKKDDIEADAIFKKTITTFTDAINGIATINLTSDDTNLELGTYYYRIKITNTNLTKTVLRGTLVIGWAE